MLRSRQFKYCVYNEGENRESLVDIRNDPGEMNNLVSTPEYKDVLIRHREYLRHWIRVSRDRQAESFAVSVE
jgi:choline-sulfatase